MLLRYKEFITEEEMTVAIDTDTKLLLSHLDKANEDLDSVTEAPFLNSALFVNTVRGTLERYGVILPTESNLQQLSMEGEVVYALGESGYFVYMVHNLNPEGNVEGYAQIVNEEDLNDLKAELGDYDNDEEIADGETSSDVSNWAKYPKARRDDDSGNTNEY